MKSRVVYTFYEQREFGETHLVVTQSTANRDDEYRVNIDMLLGDSSMSASVCLTGQNAKDLIAALQKAIKT